MGFLQKVLIPGGHIDIKVFIENFDAPWKALSKSSGLPNTVLCLRTELKVFGVPEVLQSLKNCRIIL